MKRIAFLLSLAGALVAPRVAAAELNVVTTTADLASVAQAVGGKHAKVTALALPTQDPHFVDARPHLALALSRADLLVAVGLDLEIGWLPTLQTNARNGDIQTGSRGYLDASSYVHKLEVPTRRVDRSMGDIHPGGNPHFMFDPRAAMHVAKAIADRMAELDSKNAADYRANYAKLEAQVRGKMKQWAARTASLRGKDVIAYHASFPYLADWLGMKVVDHIEPKPGIPPSPRHVAHLLQLVRDRHVDIVLQESWYPTNTSELIAQRSGAKMVRIPGGPDFEHGESYVHFIDTIVSRLARAAQS